MPPAFLQIPGDSFLCFKEPHKPLNTAQPRGATCGSDPVPQPFQETQKLAKGEQGHPPKQSHTHARVSHTRTGPTYTHRSHTHTRVSHMRTGLLSRASLFELPPPLPLRTLTSPGPSRRAPCALLGWAVLPSGCVPAAAECELGPPHTPSVTGPLPVGSELSPSVPKTAVSAGVSGSSQAPPPRSLPLGTGSLVSLPPPFLFPSASAPPTHSCTVPRPLHPHPPPPN